MSSLYPDSQDSFIRKIDEEVGGVVVPGEEDTIPASAPYTVSFDHHVSSGTNVTIPGFVSTLTNPPPIANRFYVDYTNNEMVFNSANANTAIEVTYTTDGDTVSADDINDLQEAVENIEVALGTQPANPYNTVKAFLTWLRNQFHYLSGHSHTGAEYDGPQLGMDAFSSFSIENKHVSPYAAIDASKLAYWTLSASPSGTNNLGDTLDTLQWEINQISTTSGVANIKAQGYSELTGAIVVEGLGDISVDQSGQTIRISSTTNHSHYKYRRVVTAGEASTGIVVLADGHSYNVGDDSLDIYYGTDNGFVLIDENSYTEDSSTQVTIDTAKATIEENDVLVFKYYK